MPATISDEEYAAFQAWKASGGAQAAPMGPSGFGSPGGAPGFRPPMMPGRRGDPFGNGGMPPGQWITNPDGTARPDGQWETTPGGGQRFKFRDGTYATGGNVPVMGHGGAAMPTRPVGADPRGAWSFAQGADGVDEYRWTAPGQAGAQTTQGANGYAWAPASMGTPAAAPPPAPAPAAPQSPRPPGSPPPERRPQFDPMRGMVR